MKIKKAFLLSFALFLVGIAGFSSNALATANAGGQVISKGQITFYEGTLDSSSTEPSTTEPSTAPSVTTPSDDSSSVVTTIQKPQGGGTLPNTGETIQKYSWMIGGVVAALIGLILFNRRKKEEQ